MTPSALHVSSCVSRILSLRLHNVASSHFPCLPSPRLQKCIFRNFVSEIDVSGEEGRILLLLQESEPPPEASLRREAAATAPAGGLLTLVLGHLVCLVSTRLVSRWDAAVLSISP